MSIGRKILIFMMLLVFAAGLVVFFYPTIQGYLTDYAIQEHAQEVIERIQTDNFWTEGSHAALEETIPEINQRDHWELWEAMTAYNETIWHQRQSGLCDPWAYEQPSFTLGDYGLEDEAFGVLSIPALDLNMPVYLGASEEHMASGAAQLSQTSIPTGGKNTNCVIAGHRGWGGASYFRYLPDLRVGDTVYLINLWETLTYTVTETKIINPNDIEEILIQPNRDLLTLLTCHPYASGGRQRWVVYCERDESKKTIETEVKLPIE